MMRFVQGMAEERQHTILYVTHHFEEISPDLFDHCLLLRHGQVYKIGTVEEVMNSEVISNFLRQPVKLDRMENGYYRLKFER